jgi:CheY-like chemotaxis protein
MGPVAERARVLVVDDEPIVREVVARCLARAGYEVDTAADGDAALAAFDPARPASGARPGRGRPCARRTRTAAVSSRDAERPVNSNMPGPSIPVGDGVNDSYRIT